MWNPFKRKKKSTCGCREFYRYVTDHHELSDEELVAKVMLNFGLKNPYDALDLVRATRGMNGYYAKLGNRACV